MNKLQNIQNDPRVRTQLDALGMQYEVTSGGDYKIAFDLGDGRSQIVYVESDTRTVGVLEIRNIWSGAYVSDEP